MHIPCTPICGLHVVTPADSMNASLGMGLSIVSKLEGECLGGCGVVVAQWSEQSQRPWEHCLFMNGGGGCGI